MLYAFGEYELDAQRYELRHAGELRKIEPQVFNVLAYLIQHRERTVTRQELLEQLWPEQYISDAVVSYCIMAARKAVGDSGRTQRIIKTVHGRGFRFVAPLQARGHASPRVESVKAAATPSHTTRQQHTEALSDSVPGADARPVPGAGTVGATALTTVLCATVTKATALAGQLGFDQLQRLRQAFFTMASQLAHQYEGTLQFFGADGILLLFGLTPTSADHAQRALLAAMELQRYVRTHYTVCNIPHVTESAVRMGLHTGPVARDTLASDQPITTTAMAETMHLAVWLQYLTAPGTLLVSDATMQLLPDEAPSAVRQEVHVPGQPQPVVAYAMRQTGA